MLERADRVGGRTSAIEADGYRFDVGPTFFMYPRVLSEIFATAGYDLEREVELVKLDPAIPPHLWRRRRALLHPSDLERMEKAVAAIAPRRCKGAGAVHD